MGEEGDGQGCYNLELSGLEAETQNEVLVGARILDVADEGKPPCHPTAQAPGMKVLLRVRPLVEGNGPCPLDFLHRHS